MSVMRQLRAIPIAIRGLALLGWILPAHALEAVSTFAGTPTKSGHLDGTVLAARFSDPVGLALDSGGNLWVADSGNHCLRRISPTGIVSTVAGSPGVPGSTDGTGSLARFDTPSALAAAADGTLYVSDTGNHTIRRIDRNGRVATLAGLAGQPGATNGVGSRARFNSPLGMAVASDGSLWIADSGNHVIRRMDPQGKVSVMAGVPEVWGDDDGPAASARFNGPVGLAFDSSGNLVISDSLNHTLRRLTAGGTVTTAAGKSGEDGSTDGLPSEARFGTPAELSFDTRGNLFVTDAFYHTIRRVQADGRVSTVAGLAGAEGGSDGGYSRARFFNPYGLVITARGSLIVTDTFNQTIRELVAPFFLSVETRPTGIHLRWESQRGLRYQVFSRTGLDAPWDPVGEPLTAVDPVSEWSPAAPSLSPNRWYQVTLLP